MGIACLRTVSIRELFARCEHVDHVEGGLWLIVGHHVTGVPDYSLWYVQSVIEVRKLSLRGHAMITSISLLWIMIISCRVNDFENQIYFTALSNFSKLSRQI